MSQKFWTSTYKGPYLSIVLMPEVWVILLLVLFFLWSFGVFLKSENSLKAVQDLGFKNAKVTHTHTFASIFYGCGARSLSAVEVDATDLHDRQTHLMVCHGFIGKPSVFKAEE